MLYISPEIKKSLFVDTQICPCTCAFLLLNNNNKKKNPCCFGYKMVEEKRHT